jgi:glycosyltransferase involved in cell wall biosynthesis
MTIHEIAQPQPGAPLLARAAIARTNRANFLHPHIHAYIVHTGADRDTLAALGAPPERIHVLTHGVPRPAAMPGAAAAKRALGLEQRRVLTLFGFLSMKKGHDIALEALSLLPDDVALLLAGDRHPDDHTDYVDRLRDSIDALGLEDRVRITGYLPEEQIPTVMAATDVALAPYLQSSGSGSLANLLAYGRAVVASDIPPHREIAADAPACLALFPGGDADALARQVQELLADSRVRAALQNRALAYADRHSYAEMARETLVIYRSVLQQRF